MLAFERVGLGIPASDAVRKDLVADQETDGGQAQAQGGEHREPSHGFRRLGIDEEHANQPSVPQGGE